METIYNFSVKDAELNDVRLSDFKNQIVLIVNVASYCGLTYQYKGLEKLYRKYQNKGFEILGFPCNQFAFQEPGTNKEISIFCEKQYGVTFPIMSKISVKGNDIHPLFIFLTKKSLNGFSDSSVKWNFQKFLIGNDGKLQLVISPWTSPDDPKIINWIKG